MPIATSKNLTAAGIAGIVAAVATAVVYLFDGDPATNVDWGLLIATVYTGIIAIFAKGQATTGGTVPATPEAATRVAADTK